MNTTVPQITALASTSGTVESAGTGRQADQEDQAARGLGGQKGSEVQGPAELGVPEIICKNES